MDRISRHGKSVTMTATHLAELEPATLAAVTRLRDSAEVSLANARTALGCDAETADAKSLARRLNTLAELEGRVFVFRTVTHLNANDRADEIHAWLLEQAVRGADDNWGGRTNDVARARHDGVLRAIREIAQETHGL